MGDGCYWALLGVIGRYWALLGVLFKAGQIKRQKFASQFTFQKKLI